MSDTITAPDTAPKLPPLPNYSLATEMLGPVGSQVEYLTAKFGNPVRSVTVKPLTMGEQWDLSEISPAGVGETWLNMAQIAFSVTHIDGVPAPRFAERRHLRNTLDKLGVDGLRAGSMALARVFDQAAPADTAPAPAAAPAPGAPDTALLATAKN